LPFDVLDQLIEDSLNSRNDLRGRCFRTKDDVESQRLPCTLTSAGKYPAR